MNISLLCKWWWKLENEDGIWQTLVKAKYLKGRPIADVQYKMGDSHVWTDLLKIKDIYLRGRRLQTKNGKNTILWSDSWLNNKPLCVTYHVLYDLCSEKDITVFDFLRKNGQIGFCRRLPPILFSSWVDMMNDIFSFHFENSPDKIGWRWNRNGKFSTKSVYEHISHRSCRGDFKHIWKSRLPYKIKIFTWLVENKVVLTRDNLKRKNWPGDPSCCFCPQIETVDHLFFTCPVARVTWGIVSICLGATNIPQNTSQYRPWIKRWLPGGEAVHHLGFAGICWALWKC